MEPAVHSVLVSGEADLAKCLLLIRRVANTAGFGEVDIAKITTAVSASASSKCIIKLYNQTYLSYIYK